MTYGYSRCLIHCRFNSQPGMFEMCNLPLSAGIKTNHRSTVSWLKPPKMPRSNVGQLYIFKWLVLNPTLLLICSWLGAAQSKPFLFWKEKTDQPKHRRFLWPKRHKQVEKTTRRIQMGNSFSSSVDHVPKWHRTTRCFDLLWNHIWTTKSMCLLEQ